MITSISNGSNLNLGKHCGNETGQTALVIGDYAVLMFHTDHFQESKGFLLLFTTITEGKLNQKTDRFLSRKELPTKEYPGGELPYRKDGILSVPFTLGLKKRFWYLFGCSVSKGSLHTVAAPAVRGAVKT